MTRAPVPLEDLAVADKRLNVVGVRILVPGVVKFT